MQTQENTIEKLRQAVVESQLSKRRGESQTVDLLRRASTESQPRPNSSSARELAFTKK